MARQTFIGMKAYTGNGIEAKGASIRLEQIETFIKLCKEKRIGFIGGYRGEDTIYLEAIELHLVDTLSAEELRTKYPKEEAFFQAEVYNYSRLFGETPAKILYKLLHQLEVEKGFTVYFDYKGVVQVLTRDEELIQGNTK